MIDLEVCSREAFLKKSYSATSSVSEAAVAGYARGQSRCEASIGLSVSSIIANLVVLQSERNKAMREDKHGKTTDFLRRRLQVL